MKNSIPIDLIYEIVSRLPAKSAARFRCVSKQWRSILVRQDFTDLFLTRSKARPRLLIAVTRKDDGVWSFYSTPQPQNPYNKSSQSPLVATNFKLKYRAGNCSHASGLLYFHDMFIPKEGRKRVLCNPLTGHDVILPELEGPSYSCLGFDPISNEFKVLLMSTRDYMASSDLDHYILTLRGGGELRWRKIQCPFTHEPLWKRVCINGVLYYFAIHSDGMSYVVICFDVRSESFKLVNTECSYNYRFNNLVSYKGKLCGIVLDYADGYYSGGLLLKFSMWILEDVDKQEWSKHVYSFSVESDVVKFDRNFSVSGMTATGDIVLSMIYASTPFYVFYFNPEKNTLQIVEILGVEANHDYRVYAFVDYVEDLSVNGAMQLDSSVPLQQGGSIVV